MPDPVPASPARGRRPHRRRLTLRPRCVVAGPDTSPGTRHVPKDHGLAIETSGTSTWATTSAKALTGSRRPARAAAVDYRVRHRRGHGARRRAPASSPCFSGGCLPPLLVLALAACCDRSRASPLFARAARTPPPHAVKAQTPTPAAKASVSFGDQASSSACCDAIRPALEHRCQSARPPAGRRVDAKSGTRRE
jgi:hypothetical protein